MAETQFSLLRQALQSIIKQYGETLAQGSARDFYEYKKITGIIEGLSIADREIIDMEDRFMGD
tara:strand:- start:62 stop:250 length:189 start_codon:yes stop_codon:yes gene_type:complete